MPRKKQTKETAIPLTGMEPAQPATPEGEAVLEALRSNLSLLGELAMRYGNPSIASGLARLRRRGATHVLVLPLYPQYSATTTATLASTTASSPPLTATLPRRPRASSAGYSHPSPAPARPQRPAQRMPLEASLLLASRQVGNI